MQRGQRNRHSLRAGGVPLQFCLVLPDNITGFCFITSHTASETGHIPDEKDFITMRVWVIKMGEPLPTDGASYRPHRIGMLAEALVSRGHSVTWWASTLEHASKRQRYDKDTNLAVNDCFEIRLLHSLAYTKNVSARRLLNHALQARKFRRILRTETPPDIIFCCFPTIEMSRVAVEYGRKHGIPVVLDVRDLWPDNFLSVLPGRIQPLAQLALTPYYRQTRQAFQEATAVVGISDGYLRFGLNYAGRPQGPNDAVIPLGYQRPVVDGSRLTQAADRLQSLGVRTDKRIFWFVGMFGKTYDLETVIAAARELSRQGADDIQFVLSGTGESETALREAAKGLENVVFTGRINAVELAAMARLAHVGLMAYTQGAPQGLPNKLFEYMCAGLPILSCLEGETNALLAEHTCGLSYTPGDAQSLTQAALLLAENPLQRREMGENGRRLFEERYSADKVYRRLAEYLEAMAPSHPHEAQTTARTERELAQAA